jgi:hypothetical protein
VYLSVLFTPGNLEIIIRAEITICRCISQRGMNAPLELPGSRRVVRDSKCFAYASRSPPLIIIMASQLSVENLLSAHLQPEAVSTLA